MTASNPLARNVTNKEVEIWDKNPTKDRWVRFAVDVEVRAEPTEEPTKQDVRAPSNMVSGRAWSPGIYRALRLLGKSLDSGCSMGESVYSPSHF
jgi:hypothetical protein